MNNLRDDFIKILEKYNIEAQEKIANELIDVFSAATSTLASTCNHAYAEYARIEQVSPYHRTSQVTKFICVKCLHTLSV